MTTEQKLGMAIILHRRVQNISQEELARKASITRSYMSNIENGKKNVSLAIIAKIADTLSISMSELLDGI